MKRGRIETNNGDTMPDRTPVPRPPAILVLAEAARVVRPGGRIVLVHYITAAPPPRTRFVKALGMSTGFDMPMRAVSIYERDQAELALGAG